MTAADVRSKLTHFKKLEYKLHHDLSAPIGILYDIDVDDKSDVTKNSGRKGKRKRRDYSSDDEPAARSVMSDSDADDMICKFNNTAENVALRKDISLSFSNRPSTNVKSFGISVVLPLFDMFTIDPFKGKSEQSQQNPIGNGADVGLPRNIEKLLQLAVGLKIARQRIHLTKNGEEFLYQFRTCLETAWDMNMNSVHFEIDELVIRDSTSKPYTYKTNFNHQRKDVIGLCVIEFPYFKSGGNLTVQHGVSPKHTTSVSSKAIVATAFFSNCSHHISELHDGHTVTLLLTIHDNPLCAFHNPPSVFCHKRKYSCNMDSNLSHQKEFINRYTYLAPKLSFVKNTSAEGVISYTSYYGPERKNDTRLIGDAPKIGDVDEESFFDTASRSLYRQKGTSMTKRMDITRIFELLGKFFKWYSTYRCYYTTKIIRDACNIAGGPQGIIIGYDDFCMLDLFEKQVTDPTQFTLLLQSPRYSDHYFRCNFHTLMQTEPLFAQSWNAVFNDLPEMCGQCSSKCCLMLCKNWLESADLSTHHAYLDTLQCLLAYFADFESIEKWIGVWRMIICNSVLKWGFSFMRKSTLWNTTACKDRRNNTLTEVIAPNDTFERSLILPLKSELSNKYVMHV